MKAVIAIDSFKGSLSSLEAGAAAAEGIRRVYPSAEIKMLPIADGGEGTLDALMSCVEGEKVTLTVKDPLGRKVDASYGIIKKTKTALIEIAQAAGITLVTDAEKDIKKASTYGVGELIKDAINRGCRDFIVGLGGSATNDGGTGMLASLGYEFLDENGNKLENGCAPLEKLRRIETKNALPELCECRFRVACDVKNTLCGENGCSAVFGRQKGATDEMIPYLDACLENYAKVASNTLGHDDSNKEGVGAAGGLGYAFSAFLGGTLVSGIELVCEVIELEAHVKNADAVITGEGRLDGQSGMGKAPVGVATLAKKYGKTVVAFAGCVTEDAATCNENGIDAFFPIVRTPCTLEFAMNKDNAKRNLANTAEQAFRLIRAAK